jgi:enoyl-CoA hydratase/carnithine racemase
MSFQQIAYERRGEAVWVTLDRPGELNALTAIMIGELNAAIDRVEADPEVACMVITGRGRAFCAGADLKLVLDFPAEDREAATGAFLDEATRMISRLEGLPKPVIAAVNGIATAGGMELLLACDIVIASDVARLGDGHANYGLLPGGGASVRLSRKLGANHAKYLFFTGALLPVVDPIFARLVTRIAPADGLQAEVEALTGQIASKSPLGLSIMKGLADAAFDRSVAEGLAAEHAANIGYASTHDRNEGLLAFRERRAPVFTGR